MMDAIILAGGFGTRLQSVVSDVPKPMAPINGKPFLEILLKSLEKKGIKRVVLSVGYKAEIIMNYFGNSYGDIELVYEVEDAPLGTGGAIKAALGKCNTEKVLVVNGDTFIDIDIEKFESLWLLHQSPVIGTTEINKNDRYGELVIKDGVIINFKEKNEANSHEKVTVNAGCYLLPRSIFFGFFENNPFSFELDFIRGDIKERVYLACQMPGIFIDIGVPHDYESAQVLLKDI